MILSSGRKAKLIIFSSIFVLALTHQNCTKVGVQDLGQASKIAVPLDCTEETCNNDTPPVLESEFSPIAEPQPVPVPAPQPPSVPPVIPQFACQKIVPLAMSNTLQIPARTAEGICYSVKIMDAVSRSSSYLTADQDGDVEARDHGKDSLITLDVAHPYVLGMESVDIILADRRFVKLSGAADRLSPILVDNFIVSGIFPKSMANASFPFYKAYGTADSAIQGSDSILFQNQKLLLKPFGNSGTSSVQALDITSDIQPNVIHTLDVRALDCGGIRELSEIYLLFQ